VTEKLNKEELKEGFKEPEVHLENVFKQDEPSENKVHEKEVPVKPVKPRAKRLLRPNTNTVSEVNQKNIIKKNKNINNNFSEKKESSVRIAFLGGINEFGKNVTLFECNGDMFLLDCGMCFPDSTMPGIDLVLPDFTYVEKNKDKIKGLILTHGHEDHIGAVPFLLKKINLPIYGTKLTLGLVSVKLKEAGLLKKAKLNVVKPGKKIRLGCMTAEFIHVNHSIPGAVAVAIYTPTGILIHTGDFKIDCTPPQDSMIDLGKFAELGKQGVLALLAESSGAERSGYTMTEQKVAASFDNLFREAERSRIIIASFASNIGRIKQIIDCSAKYDRKIAFSGRSMGNYVGVAQELGYINIPENIIIEPDLLNKYPKEKTVLITTGSQGESMSALTRMAYSDHRKISVGPEDFVIISANPIPGNEKSISAVVNELMKLGCKVVYESMRDIHVSGHACQEELKIIQGLVKPKFFIPVHGEQRQLRRHADLAKSMGVPESNIYISDIGHLIEINKDCIKQVGTVPSGRIFVDGSGIGDVGNVVLKERKMLAEDGVIIVAAGVNKVGHAIAGPEVVTKGFVYEKRSEALLEEARKMVVFLLEYYANKNISELRVIKGKLKDELYKFFYNKTKRRPIILPIIMQL